MKITDETKTFAGEDHDVTLEVSSMFGDTHDMPSLYLVVDNPEEYNPIGFSSDDPDQIKEIIQHMAKMAGLEVAFSERFVPRYQPGDRVRSLMEDTKGRVGTVIADKEHRDNWNVRVKLDDDDHGTGLYMHDELELVSGE